MKKILTSLCVMGALGAAAVTATAQDLKIATFNLQRVLSESKAADLASDRLTQEGQRRQNEVDALTKRFKQRYEQFQSNSATMTESERLEQQRQLAELERDVSRRKMEMNDEMNQRRNEEVALLQEQASRILNKIAKDGKYDLIVTDYFYASPRIDITDEVIKEIDKTVKKK